MAWLVCSMLEYRDLWAQRIRVVARPYRSRADSPRHHSGAARDLNESVGRDSEPAKI